MGRVFVAIVDMNAIFKLLSFVSSFDLNLLGDKGDMRKEQKTLLYININNNTPQSQT